MFTSRSNLMTLIKESVDVCSLQLHRLTILIVLDLLRFIHLKPKKKKKKNVLHFYLQLLILYIQESKSTRCLQHKTKSKLQSFFCVCFWIISYHHLCFSLFLTLSFTCVLTYKLWSITKLIVCGINYQDKNIIKKEKCSVHWMIFPQTYSHINSVLCFGPG